MLQTWCTRSRGSAWRWATLPPNSVHARAVAPPPKSESVCPAAGKSNWVLRVCQTCVCLMLSRSLAFRWTRGRFRLVNRVVQHAACFAAVASDLVVFRQCGSVIIYGSRMRAPLSQSSAFQRLVGTHTSHEPGRFSSRQLGYHTFLRGNQWHDPPPFPVLHGPPSSQSSATLKVHIPINS